MTAGEKNKYLIKQTNKQKVVVREHKRQQGTRSRNDDWKRNHFSKYLSRLLFGKHSVVNNELFYQGYEVVKSLSEKVQEVLFKNDFFLNTTEMA